MCCGRTICAHFEISRLWLSNGARNCRKRMPFESLDGYALIMVKWISFEGVAWFIIVVFNDRDEKDYFLRLHVLYGDYGSPHLPQMWVGAGLWFSAGVYIEMTMYIQCLNRRKKWRTQMANQPRRGLGGWEYRYRGFRRQFIWISRLSSAVDASSRIPHHNHPLFS